jgi:hypothetical protein
LIVFALFRNFFLVANIYCYEKADARGLTANELGESQQRQQAREQAEQARIAAQTVTRTITPPYLPAPLPSRIPC